MDKIEPAFHFKLMAFTYKFRDFFFPRIDVLKEIGIKRGFHILDYGCGPGSYIVPLAKLVGENGKIYALDIHPIAIDMVKKIVKKNQLKNVITICSDLNTGLSDKSIDVALLYDTYHNLSEPDKVIKELHRVLKENGILSFSDHHMKENEIIDKIQNKGLFKLLKKGKKTYTFLKLT